MSDMTTIQLALPTSTYLALKQAAEQKHQTETELVIEAIQTYLEQLAKIDRLLGLFASEPDLIDDIVRDVLQDRERMPWRQSEVLGYPLKLDNWR